MTTLDIAPDVAVIGKTDLGGRVMLCRLREPKPGLGLKAGDYAAVDIDLPMVAGDFALVEFQGGVFIREVSRSDLSLQVHIGGRDWPLIRAGWGSQEAPIALGKLVASGRPL